MKLPFVMGSSVLKTQCQMQLMKKCANAQLNVMLLIIHINTISTPFNAGEMCPVTILSDDCLMKKLYMSPMPCHHSC